MGFNKTYYERKKVLLVIEDKEGFFTIYNFPNTEISTEVRSLQNIKIDLNIIKEEKDNFLFTVIKPKKEDKLWKRVSKIFKKMSKPNG